MMADTAPAYLSTPMASQAYDLLHSGSENALSGVAGQKITATFEGRRSITPADVAGTTKNVLIELQFERPLEVHHSIVVLAEAESLTRLFALTPSDDGEILGAESLLSLGDIVSTFLDTLGGELTYLQPTPRAWLANLEPIAPDASGGVHVDLPPLVTGEQSLFLADLTLAGDGVLCPLQLVFGENAEQALLGMDTAAGAEPRDLADPDDLGVAPTPTATGAAAMATPSSQETPKSASTVASSTAATVPPANATPVQPAQFRPLAPESTIGRANSIDLIRDVPLQISVELGRASLTVREILALGVGSVVELDRLAGEPVDVLVNDRLIGRGEVVIVDESFGVRLTEIFRESNRR